MPISLSQLDILSSPLHDHFLYKITPDQQLMIEQALSPPSDAFKKNRDGNIDPEKNSFSYTRLDLNNDGATDRRLVLQIDNPMIQRLAIFVVVDQQLVKTEFLEDGTPTDLPLKNSLPHVIFNAPQGKVSHIYLRVKTEDSSFLPLQLHDEHTFQTKVYQTFLTWGAFIGIILIMTTYNLMLYIGVRDKIYLYYIGYILSLLLQLGVVYGFGEHLFPYPLQFWFGHHRVVLDILISIFAILFTLYFLRYDVQRNTLYTGSLYFCGALALLGLCALVAPQLISAKAYYPFQLLSFLLIVRMCIPKILDGARWSTFYLISWLPLFIGITITQALWLGLINYHYLSRNALLFSVLIEIVLISFAIAMRYRADDDEKIYNVTHDTVTGLPNKILLNECISRQIGAMQHFSLILFQAERFKEIKPALGLIAANNLISAIVDNVSNYFSAMTNLYVFERTHTVDIRLSRIDDDTFGLLLQDDHDQEALTYIILTIQEAVSTPISVGGYNVSTSCAVGLVSYPAHGLNAEAMLQKATHALDIARKEGCKYSFFSDEDKVKAQAQLQLVADLQKAIDNDTLEIYHQPQIHLTQQTLCGNEALLRWDHPTRGFISPEIFVKLAEDTGVINQLTEWVITKSLVQHAQIIAAGFNQNISINLSAKDLTQCGLIAHIMTTIADLAVDPATIIFELTESATSDNPIHALNTINQLHELGLKVAIDDFGTGYSSLEYISKLPFHELKVDKSFVLDILQSKRDQAITKTTIEMAKNLNIFVVAEGIETVEIENLLRSYQCEIGQGYYYSKPLPINKYLEWLDKDNKYIANQRQIDSQTSLSRDQSEN